MLEDPTALPDGSKVVLVVLTEEESLNQSDSTHRFGNLMAFAGALSGFPEDASENLDHYLYGTPSGCIQRTGLIESVGKEIRLEAAATT